jgi:hypothetical protein
MKLKGILLGLEGEILVNIDLYRMIFLDEGLI